MNRLQTIVVVLIFAVSSFAANPTAREYFRQAAYEYAAGK